jgi:hypothetical protein
VLQVICSEVRVEFDLSASDNWIAPSTPILLSVSSEDETKRLLPSRMSSVRDVFDLSALANRVAPLGPMCKSS